MPQHESTAGQESSRPPTRTRARSVGMLVMGAGVAGLLTACAPDVDQEASSLTCDSVVVEHTPQTTGDAIDNLLQELPGEQSGLITVEAAKLLHPQPEGTEIVGCVQDGDAVGIAVVKHDGSLKQQFVFNSNGTFAMPDKVQMPDAWPPQK